MSVCEFSWVSSEVRHILGVIDISPKVLWVCKGLKVHELENTRGHNERIKWHSSCSSPSSWSELPTRGIRLFINRELEKASVRLGTWQTDCVSLNRSSAAIFTTKVNSKRVLMQEQLMSKYAVPIWRKQVEAHSNNWACWNHWGLMTFT